MLALAAAPAAHALQPEAPCRSKTGRPLASIAVAYGTHGTRAVWIAPGETLCLRLLASGYGPTAVQAVQGGSGSDVVNIALEVTAGRSVLRVRNALPYALHYRAAVSASDHVLRETHVLPVAADSESTEVWNDALPGLALYDLRVARAALPPIDRPAEPPWREEFGVGAAIGATWNALDELNADLERHGFGAQRSLQPLAGMDMEYRSGRVAASVDILLGFARGIDGVGPGLYQNWLALHGGACILCGHLDVTPMLGIGWGRVSLEVDRDDPSLSIAGIDRLSEDTEVERSMGLLFGSLSMRYRLRVSGRIAMYVGLRAGYAWQFDQSGWGPSYSGDDFLRGGPEVDTSGPYLRLAVGFSGLM
jgi:hypothetical protein